MIHVIVGTKAQLIKMAPVMRCLESRKIRYNYIATGQHQSTVDEIHVNFGIRKPDFTIYDGQDITSITRMFWFGIFVLRETVLRRTDIFKGDRNGVVLVHGDTFSTLLGAVMARLSGLKIAHVESGLRSFNLLSPFPEELTRILVFALSDIYFCPCDWAVCNLKRFSGVKVNTHGNTLMDSLDFALKSTVNEEVTLIPNSPYVIVTLHRFERIRSRKSLEQAVQIVLDIANQFRILFVLHKPTEARLRSFGLYDKVACHENIELHGRYDYFDFIRLLKESEFVVSDGGSNQEECYYLGKPCLLLRKFTERREGLGRNVVLSEMNVEVIRQFVGHYDDYLFDAIENEKSPSGLIVDFCGRYAS